MTSKRVLEGVLGVDTAVFETGQGPDVLLLHGNPDTHHAWDAVIERLAPKHRCIAPDLPGYGESRVPSSFEYSVAHQGEYVAALVRALGLSRVHLVVHDVGGPYGLSFAAQNPKMLASLTIFNTSFFPETPWHFWAKVWRTPVLGELAMKLSTRGLFVREMLLGAPRLPRASAEEAWSRYSRETRREVLRWYRAMDLDKVLVGWDKRLLEAIANVPRQVVWGDLDVYIPSSVAERYEAPIMHRYADCGHWVMLERPDEAASHIADLVASST